MHLLATIAFFALGLVALCLVREVAKGRHSFAVLPWFLPVFAAASFGWAVLIASRA